MNIPTFLTGTEEYVTAEMTGSAVLNAQVVTIFIDGTEYPATWLGDAGVTRQARTTTAVDFTSFDDGLYRLGIKYIDTNESPYVDAGWIRVKTAAVAV